jgi:aldehyde dehydrogenase (NAD+)
MTTARQAANGDLTAIAPSRERFGLVIGEPDLPGAQARETVNPATGEPLATVSAAGAEDVDRAVQLAVAVQPGWAALDPLARQASINAFADRVHGAKDELALLETLDNGMPLANARASVDRAVDQLRFSASCVAHIAGQSRGPVRPNSRFLGYTRRRPVGVVAAIIPWNAPLVSASLKISVALAAGCSEVLKPAMEAPLTAIRLGELALESGIPPGVLSVVPGDGPTVGRELVEHSLVDKISFTGSTEVGREILRRSAWRLARTTLELGGKSPDIVFDDVDIDDVVPKAAWAIFRSSGQVCTAGSRLFVQEAIYERFVERLVEFTETIRVGNGLLPETQLGPLISATQVERVIGYVDSARAEGATLLAGGSRLHDEDRPSGLFVAPTVFSDVRPGMRIVREEVFGPVVTVTPFATVDDAVAMGNDTTYGLAAAVWTDRLDVAHDVASRLHAGVVWVNCHAVNDPSLPYGAQKMSGYGAKAGMEAILECTEVTTVVIDLP